MEGTPPGVDEYALNCMIVVGRESEGADRCGDGDGDVVPREGLLCGPENLNRREGIGAEGLEATME